MLSPSRITLENNGKIRPQPDRENAFARASGGGNGTGIGRSLDWSEPGWPKDLQQILDVRQRKREAGLQHNRQADYLAARFEIAKWIRFAHPTRLRNRPARLKPSFSDGAVRSHRHGICSGFRICLHFGLFSRFMKALFARMASGLWRVRDALGQTPRRIRRKCSCPTCSRRFRLDRSP